MAAIRDRTAACSRSLRLLAAALESGPVEHRSLIDPTSLEDEYGRFRVWSGNLGAQQKGHGSLDYRLRDSPLLHSNVLKLLHELEINVNEARAVVTGARLPYEQQAARGDFSDDSASDDSEDEDGSSDEGRPRFELQQRMFEIMDIINSLYRLSIRIRNPTIRIRSLKAATYRQIDPDTGVDVLSQYAEYDRRYVADSLAQLRAGFPQRKNEDVAFLVDRLSKAITKRRQQFKYWKKHRDKLAVSAPAKEDVPPIGGDQGPQPQPGTNGIDSSVQAPNVVKFDLRAPPSEAQPRTLLSGTEATAHHRTLDDAVDSQSVTQIPYFAGLATVCTNDPGIAGDLHNHIANHLEKFASFALPKFTGMEDDKSGASMDAIHGRKSESDESEAASSHWSAATASSYEAGRLSSGHQDLDLETPGGDLTTQRASLGQDTGHPELSASAVQSVPDATEDKMVRFMEMARASPSDHDTVSTVTSIASDEGKRAFEIHSIDTASGDDREKAPSISLESSKQPHTIRISNLPAGDEANRRLFAFFEKLNCQRFTLDPHVKDRGYVTFDNQENADEALLSFDKTEFPGVDLDLEHSGEKEMSKATSLPGGVGVMFDVQGFLEALSRVLGESKHRKTIAWAQDGKAFRILDEEAFSRDILPTFGFDMFSSFKDSLIACGFCQQVDKQYRIDTSGPKRSSMWFHKHFQRDSPEVSGRTQFFTRLQNVFGLAKIGPLATQNIATEIDDLHRWSSMDTFPLKAASAIPSIAQLYVNSELFVPDWVQNSLRASGEASLPPPKDEVNRKISMILHDITKIDVDAIVNATTQGLNVGASDSIGYRVHRAAGPELLRECRAIEHCKMSQAVMTDAYNLPCRKVIHTVRPHYYQAAQFVGGEDLLASCYWNCLKLAVDSGLKSIAFPCLSAGGFGFPIREATEIALRTTRAFLDAGEGDSLEKIIFCVYKKMDKLVYRDMIPRFFPPTKTLLGQPNEREVQVETLTSSPGESPVQEQDDVSDAGTETAESGKPKRPNASRLSGSAEGLSRLTGEASARSRPNSPTQNHKPNYVKVHREHLSLDTLFYYDLPFEFDRADPNYIIILRELNEKLTDTLFGHSREHRRNLPSLIRTRTHPDPLDAQQMIRIGSDPSFNTQNRPAVGAGPIFLPGPCVAADHCAFSIDQQTQRWIISVTGGARATLNGRWIVPLKTGANETVATTHGSNLPEHNGDGFFVKSGDILGIGDDDIDMKPVHMFRIELDSLGGAAAGEDALWEEAETRALRHGFPITGLGQDADDDDDDDDDDDIDADLDISAGYRIIDAAAQVPEAARGSTSARWTRLDRRLVNPDALNEAGLPFENRIRYLLVFRELVPAEVQRLATRTREGRAMKAETEFTRKERRRKERRVREQMKAARERKKTQAGDGPSSMLGQDE
ncbi:hypothetical protein SLS58_009360 [Diplodia intermedia]|uniref:ADP-ribose 1''-phosphate phosphatase n=1 Tax=Diplodia intermedia TaxID=856260 RepID=A0ABR3TCV8_9PEZI